MGAKKSQSNNGQKNQVGPVLLLLGILAALLVLAKLIGLFMSWASPAGIIPEQKFSWDGASSVNLVFVYPDARDEANQSLVNFNPQTNQLTILDISNQAFFELPRGYGSWQMGSVYSLGQDDNPPHGGELIRLATSRLVGLPVDGVVVAKGSKNETANWISNFHKNNFQILSFLGQVKSDLSPIEQARLYWQFSEVRPDKVVTLNFLHSDITVSKLLPDSSRVLGVNTVSLDIFIRQNLADSSFTSEDKEITILNGTDRPGLTQQASRLVTNLGGTVISVGNTVTPQKTSYMIIKKKDAEDSITAKRLAEIFAPNCQKGCQNSDPSVDASRAQIVVVLGQDYYQYWNSK